MSENKIFQTRSIWQSVVALPLTLAVIQIEKLHVDNSQSAFESLMACARSYEEKYCNQPIGTVAGVHFARKLFHSMAVDPTRRRPSSEALLHRALKGKELYSVNSLVDIGNWCSLDFLLPICVYDSDKITGQMTIRTGRPDESYSALNNQTIHLYERFVLADDQGAFGSPLTDSQRTAVDLQTQNTTLVIFAPSHYVKSLLQKQAALFAQRVNMICGGSAPLIETS